MSEVPAREASGTGTAEAAAVVEAPVEVKEGEALTPDTAKVDPKPEGEEVKADGEGEQEPEEDAKAAQKRRDRDYRRLIRRNAVLEERERERLKALPEGDRREERASPKDDDPKPVWDQEKDPYGHEHGAELAAWRVRQEMAKFQGKLREDSERDQLQSSAKTVLAKFEERAALFKKAVPDFDEVMAEDFEVVPSQTIAALVARNEAGPAIAYHLAKNSEVTERLNELSPLDAAMELGRIAQRLTLATPKRSTGAPPPLRPVKNGAGISKDPAKMTMEEFAKARETGALT